MSAVAPENALLAGRFVIEREVGRGGVGIVYRASDQVTGTPVALKVIAIPGVDAGEEARFGREGRVLAGLSHPGIVRVVAFGQLEEGHPYVAMEWLEGEDIAQRQKRAPLTFAAALEIGAQVADALDYAHSVGIVHRDIKPSNVILLGDPLTAKLVDFGVASAEDARLTRTGAIIGTPAYMAPEQARGDAEVDARSDIYGLGATLFEMIAGRPPHLGPTPIAILARLVTTPAPRLGEVFTGAPISLDDLLCEMLATHPEERPARAGEVAARLRAIALEIENQPLHTRTQSPEMADRSMGSLVLSTSSKTGGSRLVTSILATHVPKGPARQRIIAHLRARGAEATELGGDAIVAHLGVRKATGDEATRALDLSLRLAAMGASVGVATGRTRIDRTRPTGEVVDRAAALARDAQKTQVLADTTTSELARGRFEMVVRPDGTSIVGVKTNAKKEVAGGSPFVGREADLSQVVTAFERCQEDQTPIIVTLTGAPGIGKTRLRREALAQIAAHPSAPHVVLVRSESFAKSHALGVMAEVARGLAGVERGGSLEDAQIAVDQLLARLELSQPSTRELVARLVANEPLPDGGDGRAARDALWIALTDISHRVSRGAALVIALEDAQWGRPRVAFVARPPPRALARACGVRPRHREAHPLARRSRAVRWSRPRAHRAPAPRTAHRPFDREGDPRRQGEHDRGRGARRVDLGAGRRLAALRRGARASRASGPRRGERTHHRGRDPGQPRRPRRGRARGGDEALRLRPPGLGSGPHRARCEERAGGHCARSARPSSSSSTPCRVSRTRASGPSSTRSPGRSRTRRSARSSSRGSTRRRGAGSRKWARTTRPSRGTSSSEASPSRPPTISKKPPVVRSARARSARRSVSRKSRSISRKIARRSSSARSSSTRRGSVSTRVRASARRRCARCRTPSMTRRARCARWERRVRYENACGGGPETSAGLEEVIQRAKAAGLFDEVARSAADLAARYAFAGELDKAADWADSLLDLARTQGIPSAAVDAWQTLAIVRQGRGDVGAALEARRSAVRAAAEAGLKTREATLLVNVGFALTTMGAKDEARVAIEEGIALAQAVGSPGTVRHGQMNLLCWVANFGSDPALDSLLADPRAIGDNAASGAWVPHDRATLGVLFYRGLELLRTDATSEQARTLLKTAAAGYRGTKMLDVVPVAVGFWAEAERRCGQAERALELATEAADLLEHGSPSLLNEAPIYLALHAALVDLGRPTDAKKAIARGLPRLVTRVHGLLGTPHAQEFLANVDANAGLISRGEGLRDPPARARDDARSLSEAHILRRGSSRHRVRLAGCDAGCASRRIPRRHAAAIP